MTQNEVFKEIISSRRTKQTKGILLNDDNGKRVSNDRQKSQTGTMSHKNVDTLL